MAFRIGSLGDIQEQVKSAVSDAFGIGERDADTSALFKPEYFGSVKFDASRWTGNAYPGANRKTLRYGFAIMKSKGTGGLALSDSKTEIYFLQLAPQALQQREIFATNVQATRKGVIVESEGVVFKDIILSGTTGIFPGERASGLNPIPNITSPFTAPKPAAGVDPTSGRSQKSEVTTVSGYEEFLSLRQFFLKYAKLKVENNGQYFFGFINEKDNQYLVVEPLEFTMERNARSPLTYDYRIVLKAIASIDDTIQGEENTPAFDLLTSVINLSANISATLAAARVLINESEGLLLSITQALDDILITPLRQLKLATDAINSGAATVLSLPSTLLANAKNASQVKLAVAENKNSVNPSVNNFAANPATTQLTQNSNNGIVTDSFGNVTGTGASQTNSLSALTSENQNASSDADILNPDGSLSTTLTSQQYSQVIEIMNQLDNDSSTPIPRSFVEDLRNNTVMLRDNLADAVGLGSALFNEIQGRIVTQQAPALSTPTDQQFELLGALQQVVSSLNYILSNNEFFQSGADEIYSSAASSYGAIAQLNKPASVREVTIQFGDSLESIALKQFGDALRWVDVVVLNNLRSPYILADVIPNPPKGVKMPGDILLIGDR